MLEPMAQQRVALVTGGAKRVGAAIVRRLARGGFDIALTYLHSAAETTSLLHELQHLGRTAIALRADLADPEPVTAQVHQAFVQQFDRLDLLVNNASIYEPDGLERVDLQTVRRMMAIHYESPLLLCRHFAPLLRQSCGHVVNMVDLLAERPWPQYLAYCASKAALANLTLGLARELAPEVTVNGIAPGVVQWPDDYPESERQKYLKRVPLARAGTPEDAAELVHFLSTGGSYITGQIIHLDGGRSVT
jgi:pteridine reductase